MAITYLGSKLYQGVKSDRVSDSLGSSANGTNTGITLDTTNEKLGTGCYNFDGSNDKVLLGSASDWKFLSDSTANTWSIAWWMKYNDTISGGGHTIMSTTDGSTQNDGFFIDNVSGTLRLIQVDGDDGSWSSAITDANWHHYAITWNAGTATLYIDGVSKGTQACTAGSGTPQYPLTLGANNDEYYTALTLDDIGIWKRVLTTTEIRTLAGTVVQTIMNGLSQTPDGDALTMGASSESRRGERAETSSSDLIGVNVTKVTFKLKKVGSPTGTASIDVTNSSGVVQQNIGTIDVSELDTDWDTDLYAENTSATYVMVENDQVAITYTGGDGSNYIIASRASDFFDGSNTVRTYGTGTPTADASNDTIMKIEGYYNPQPTTNTGALVSSLSNKSELKAHYSMDSTSLGSAGYTEDFDSSVTYVNNGAYTISSTVSNAWNASIANTGHAGAETTIDTGITVDGGSFVMDYTMKADNISNYVFFWFGLGSVSGAATGDSQNFVGSLTTFQGNSSNGDIRGGYKDSSATWNGGTNSTGNYWSAGTTRYCRLVKDGTTITAYIYPTEADRTAGTNATATSPKTSSPATLSGLRYLQIMINDYNDGKTNTATIDDIKIYSGITNPVGCVNDHSSTSDLDSLTGVRTNSIFEQTDSTPSYWWYNGTSWVLDASTAPTETIIDWTGLSTGTDEGDGIYKTTSDNSWSNVGRSTKIYKIGGNTKVSLRTTSDHLEFGLLKTSTSNVTCFECNGNAYATDNMIIAPQSDGNVKIGDGASPSGSAVATSWDSSSYTTGTNFTMEIKSNGNVEFAMDGVVKHTFTGNASGNEFYFYVGNYGSGESRGLTLGELT